MGRWKNIEQIPLFHFHFKDDVKLNAPTPREAQTPTPKNQPTPTKLHRSEAKTEENILWMANLGHNKIGHNDSSRQVLTTVNLQDERPKLVGIISALQTY